MDAPKRDISWLESFPPDIWAYFVCYLPGEQLVRLLMTGTVSLRLRLKSPTVVKSIKLGTDLGIFKAWSQVLNEFPSLRELSIDIEKDDWSRLFGLELSSIPSGVRKLELNSEYSYRDKFFFGEDGSPLKLSEILPHLEVLNLSNLDIPDLTWLTHPPPNLTTLSFYHWDGTVELPPSLIHFTVDTIALSSTSFVSKLPPSLDSFEVLSEVIGVDLLVPLLPPSIRQLDLGFWSEQSDETVAPQSYLPHLSKLALTRFNLPKSNEFTVETPTGLISLLSSTLTELRVALDVPCSIWPQLPQTLTHLSMSTPNYQCTVVSKMIDVDGSRCEVRSIPFELLPRSITKLRMFVSNKHQYYCGPPTSPNQSSYFPPRLAHLTIRNIQLSPETVQLLPRSITYLEIGNLCERTGAHLPAGLKTLTVQRPLMSPNLIKFLPKSLTYLELALRSDVSWFDYKTAQRVDCISNLAEYSIHQNCLSNSFDWKDYSYLPPTLTHLELSGNDDLGDSFMLHQQLPNLQILRFGFSKHVTDLSIPLLSTSLTTLNFARSSNISGKSFRFLPRCLTFLDLRSSESIYDSDIQHLPRTLKIAYLGRSIHLTDLCTLDWPAQLEILSLRCNARITTASIPNLPYPLRSSQSYRTYIELDKWCIERGVLQQFPQRTE